MEFLKKVNWKTLNTYIDNGYIVANRHPEYNLWILNYTPKTQAKRYWDLYTLSCRGLVIDVDGNIIARPFQKFKNFEEHDPSEIDMSQKYEIFEKMDGSLIILFYYDKKMEWIVASRGSFTSEQALEARKMIPRNTLDVLNNENTYLFEIIYKQNRVVVDYGDMYGLVLLSRIETSTGKELCHGGMVKKYSNYFKIVKKYKIKINYLNDLKKMEEENREGFVIRFRNGFRVKVKFTEYVRLHRILTNVSNKTVWEHLMNEYDFDELYDKVPDEFYDWLKRTIQDLKNQYLQIEKDAMEEFVQIFHVENINGRKEFALRASKSEYKTILFKIYDNDDYKQIIWKMIKPVYSKPFSDGYNVFK